MDSADPKGEKLRGLPFVFNVLKYNTVKPRLSVFQGTGQIYAFKRGYLIGGIGIFTDFITLLYVLFYI